MAPGQHRFDLRSVGRRGRATPALTGAGSSRFLCGMRVAVPRHLARPRPQVVLDERVRRSRQDAPVSPATGARVERDVSGAKVAVGMRVAQRTHPQGSADRDDCGDRRRHRRPAACGRRQHIAGDRALQRGVADLEPTERAFSVTMSPDLTPTTEQLAGFNNEIERPPSTTRSRIRAAHGRIPSLGCRRWSNGSFCRNRRSSGRRPAGRRRLAGALRCRPMRGGGDRSRFRATAAGRAPACRLPAGAHDRRDRDRNERPLAQWRTTTRRE